MSERLPISLTVSGVKRLFGDDLSQLIDFAKRAEDAGIDQIAMTDHLAIGPHTERYPYGAFPFPNDEPWPEPLLTLAAMAGATRRIRLATAVLIAPLRPALLLAKSLATLDVLSGGRVDLGVGTGWQKEEFDASGVPFETRAARMDDVLRACRVLWRDAPASFQSPTVSFDDLWCIPRPVQPGGVPIWFGVAPTPRNVARVVEMGVGWVPVGTDLDALASGARVLRDAFAAAGRDPAMLGVRANVPFAIGADGRVDLDRSIAEGIPRASEAGATIAAFPIAAYVRRREDLPALLKRLARLA
ncbi:MAG: TIGR03619 family F420-dependent LLM class oxidoreductase [Proteobacteria bacterium]|nr:TIGR03619 family F420-dependent LLM class oxidoreductase [Pseudomonadota bacterium]